ncbi:superoxide dismutase [Allochromatium palmeri]|uniref:Superoxide dismutase n=1 Tax=Allochromatium palmeri TaxID=231048 RepID=A0A6N8EFE8_9GAMM|nr:superoxide dismutase [Allochromatium palmeri]MTW21064.1 superoxide dismutase [Allochromatium palmeri]
MTHRLPDLPYPADALEPRMSSETLSLHHGKHHATYVEKLNALIEGAAFGDATLSDIVAQAHGGIFNNAAQAWNHAFFWNCLRPDGGGDPRGDLAAAIDRDFGSTEALRQEFSSQLMTLFGSGWVWLAKDSDGKLSVESCGNAGNPITDGKLPILTCDIWEHAYYVDYRNQKKDYIDAFWHLVNWDFAAENFDRDAPFEP